MRKHLQEHHDIGMSEQAAEKTVQDLHHYHHTHGRATHKLNENLSPNQFPTPAEVRRAKTDRWKPS